MALKNIEEIKEEYIDAAILYFESSSDGNYRVINKQYRILKKIFQLIEKGTISKDFLTDLLLHDSIYVRTWAEVHMLGLNYETDKAEAELSKVANGPEKGVVSFDANNTLRAWIKQGYLKF